jgi:hypothetical protein
MSLARTNPAQTAGLRFLRRWQVPDFVVRLAGVEPATLGLEVRCSIQLSYRRVRHLRYTEPSTSIVVEVLPKFRSALPVVPEIRDVA